ncbi:MAG: endonuclease/exonuclease/phosphatase family protein [Spirochaetia bacterium]
MKKNSFTQAGLILPLVIFSLSGGCSLGQQDSGQVTILSYNVQNLFDEIDDGTEYPEFDPGTGKWTEELTDSKLAAVARVLLWVNDGGADIAVLQEIENVRILKRLNDEYLTRCGYEYAAAAGCDGDGVVRVGLLSRYPVTSVRSHSLYSDGGPPLREILEARISCPGGPLILFCCHWKSKYGGAEETEKYRRQAASFIRRRMESLGTGKGGAEAVIVGDLNENIDEYIRVDRVYVTALIPAGMSEPIPGTLSVTTDRNYSFTPESEVWWSPWSEWEDGGSYFYGDSWETIDHFLLTPELVYPGGLMYTDFRVLTPPFAVDNNGKPLRWITSSQSGFSDHLPILLVLKSGSE